jgi:hypothetical protein
MRRVLVLLTVVLAASLWGQEQKPEAGTGVPAVKVFRVRPPNIDRIRRTLEMVVGKEHVAADSGANTLVVTTNRALMPSVEQVVKDLDVATEPAQNVELTFYVLRGSKEPEAAAPLPAELESTIKQLRSAFAYQSFRLLDTAFIRGRSGQFANVAGRAEPLKGAPPSSYYLRVLPSVSLDARPPSIRLDALRFDWPGIGNFQADVDLKEGQKVVIGKSGIEGNQSALILVATAKLVD